MRNALPTRSALLPTRYSQTQRCGRMSGEAAVRRWLQSVDGRCHCFGGRAGHQDLLRRHHRHGERVADRLGMLVLLANLPSHPDSVPINLGTTLRGARAVDVRGTGRRPCRRGQPVCESRRHWNLGEHDVRGLLDALMEETRSEAGWLGHA